MKPSPHSMVSCIGASHDEDPMSLPQGDATLPSKPPQIPGQVLDDASAQRDAKVRALQQAIAQGTYQVPAEQLATKMLQDTLHEILP